MTDPRQVLLELFEAEIGRQGAAAPTRIELVYQPPADYRRELLRTWRIDDPRDAWAFDPRLAHREKLAATVIDLAEQRAESEGTGGRRQFRIVLHQAEGDRITRPFAILPSYDGADAELARPEHQPTSSGVIEAVMGQNHDLHKVNVKLMAAIAQLVTSMGRNQTEQLDRINRQQERMAARNLELEDQRVKALALIEEAKTLEHERALEVKALDGSEARKARALDSLEAIAQAISKHVTGGGLGKGKPSGTNGTATKNGTSPDVTTMLDEFLGSLSGEQRTELLTRLPIEQKIALAEMQRLAHAGDGTKLLDFLLVFFRKVDDATVDLLEETLTGKQKKLFDVIFARVTNYAQAAERAEAPIDTTATQATS